MSSLPLMSCYSVRVGANMSSHDTHALCRSPLILFRIFLRKNPFITFMWNSTQLWLLWDIPGWNPTLKWWGRVVLSFLSGVHICGLPLLGVLKSKNTVIYFNLALFKAL